MCRRMERDQVLGMRKLENVRAEATSGVHRALQGKNMMNDEYHDKS